jgi:hypothetical protein
MVGVPTRINEEAVGAAVVRTMRLAKRVDRMMGFIVMLRRRWCIWLYRWVYGISITECGG